MNRLARAGLGHDEAGGENAERKNTAERGQHHAKGAEKLFVVGAVAV